MAPSEQRNLSRLRSSVALPLGINGPRACGGQGAKTTLTGLPLVAGASVGKTSIASGGPMGRKSNNPFISSILSCSGRTLWGWAKAQRAGPAVLRTAKTQLIRPRFKRVEACGAHSNVSCGPPRSEASASAIQRVAEAPHNFLNFGLSPTPQSGFAAGRQGRRFYEPQKQHFLYYPIRWVRPRRAPHVPLMRRPRRGRRFRSESRYSLSD